MGSRRSRPARIRSSHQKPTFSADSAAALSPSPAPAPLPPAPTPPQPARDLLVHDAEHPRQPLPAPRLLPSPVENCLNIWRLEPRPFALRPPLVARALVVVRSPTRSQCPETSPSRPRLVPRRLWSPSIGSCNLAPSGTAIVSPPRVSPACLPIARLADGHSCGSQDHCDETTTPL